MHLDYLRYPGPSFSFDGRSLAAFDAAREAEPDLEYDEFRRRLVTETVREVRDSTRAANPDGDPWPSGSGSVTACGVTLQVLAVAVAPTPRSLTRVGPGPYL